MTKPDPIDQFFALLRASLGDGSFAKVVLGKYRGTEPDLERVIVRTMTLKGQSLLSLVYRYKTSDITKNQTVDEALITIRGLTGTAFKTAHLLTTQADIHLEFNKRGAARLTRGPASRTAEISNEHDRAKQRLLDPGRPFLQALGITNDRQQVLPSMSHKWKQINKFLEIFQHAVATSRLAGQKSLRIVDYGSGKGYLTFAIHDYLRNNLKTDAQVTGVEIRAPLVQFCNAVAEKLKLQGLDFRQGDLDSFAPETLDAMIALHACDTATDQAIHQGIRAGAEIILCAPCCHKQLRPQLKASEVLAPLLRHGIHQAQTAEMITDTLRVLLLEACNYEAQIFEFISLEHTDKNKMILAIRRPDSAPSTEVWLRIRALKEFFGIREHALETLLRAEPKSV